MNHIKSTEYAKKEILNKIAAKIMMFLITFGTSECLTTLFLKVDFMLDFHSIVTKIPCTDKETQAVINQAAIVFPIILIIMLLINLITIAPTNEYSKLQDIKLIHRDPLHS